MVVLGCDCVQFGTVADAFVTCGARLSDQPMGSRPDDEARDPYLTGRIELPSAPRHAGRKPGGRPEGPPHIQIVRVIFCRVRGRSGFKPLMAAK